MATTIVTNYTERPLKTIISIKELVQALQDQLEASQGDEDKSGEVETAAFYEGQVDICHTVLRMLTIQPVEERIEELEEHIDAYGQVLDKIERESPQFAQYHRIIDNLRQEIHDLQPKHKWDSKKSRSGYGVCICGWQTSHYAMSSDPDLDAEFDAHLEEN